MPAKRTTVDLTQFPDLVVIYLGMRVNVLSGIKTLLGFGPKITKAVAQHPEGLLLHENIFFSLRHIGMRQYWRDFDSLERWARSDPHRRWWAKYMHDTGGTGFWHEAYFMRGGMEAVYVGMDALTGLGRFARQTAPKGSMFTARGRAERAVPRKSGVGGGTAA